MSKVKYLFKISFIFKPQENEKLFYKKWIKNKIMSPTRMLSKQFIISVFKVQVVTLNYK